MDVDYLDVRQYILNNDIELCIEVIHNGTTIDKMGLVSISVIRFFRQPYVSYEEKVPLRNPTTSLVTSKVEYQFMYQ